ncbi:MAG TPA: hypothetical protein VFK02_25720 [Kofleriaceae bacterium]|nr:hypothetical protein [Kofleriaceae bacterium]
MASVRKPRARDTILYGGLTVGLLDACDATLFFGSLGARPERIAQHVASGLLGPASFEGGAATIVLGVVLHFTVAICIAATFYLLARNLPALVAHPVVSGLGFGVAAYFVMGHVVVPLSRARVSGAFSLPVFINGVVGHAVLIGLPIALFAARSVRAAYRAQGESEMTGGTRGTTPPRLPISIDP